MSAGGVLTHDEIVRRLVKGAYRLPIRGSRVLTANRRTTMQCCSLLTMEVRPGNPTE
jgi:hypothetical protein